MNPEVELGGIEPPSVEQALQALRLFPCFRPHGHRPTGLGGYGEPQPEPPGLSQMSAVFACCQRSLPPSITASVAGLQRSGPAWPHGSRYSSYCLTKSGGESEVSPIFGASVGAPFYESEQLEPHPQHLVSTSKPISPVVEAPSLRCTSAIYERPDVKERGPLRPTTQCSARGLSGCGPPARGGPRGLRRAWRSAGACPPCGGPGPSRAPASPGCP